MVAADWAGAGDRQRHWRACRLFRRALSRARSGSRAMFILMRSRRSPRGAGSGSCRIYVSRSSSIPRRPNGRSIVPTRSSASTWNLTVVMTRNPQRRAVLTSCSTSTWSRSRPGSQLLGCLTAQQGPQLGGALIHGSWLRADVETAPSNVAFDQQLRERAPEWGLRRVEDFDAAASDRGFQLEQTRAMPANNLMLLFRLAC